MRSSVVGVAVVLAAGFALGRLFAREPMGAAPVAARLYTIAFAEGTMAAAHREYEPVHGMYLPGVKVTVSLRFTYVSHGRDPSEDVPRLHAYPGDKPEGDGVALYGSPTGIEETQIPADLAEDIVGLAHLNRRHDEEGRRLGADVAERLGLAPIAREPADRRVTPAPPREAASTDVAAKAYRMRVYEGFTDFNHGGGTWVHTFFLPESKTVAILNFLVRYDADGKYVLYPRLFAHTREMGDVDSTADDPNPIEDVRLPADLAERFRALAALAARCSEESLRLGREVRTRLGLEPIPNPNGQ